MSADSRQPAALRRFRHIAVEGAMASGKTALALRLARYLDAETLLEHAEDNPFLERFYDDSAGYAFQAQLFFLFQRLRLVRELAQPGMFVAAVVSDFMFARDALFARLNLGDEEYRLYTQMYAQLAPQVPQPDLVIWLQAGPQALAQRIRRRALAAELRMAPAYLPALCAAYAEHFRNYDAAPVLAVDTEEFDPAGNDADFALLLDRLAGFNGRRAFLDREPAAAPSTS